MTALRYVTKKQMIDETGMDTLGYAKPKNGLILIRKGLDKKTEHEVRAHEFEHIKKGEEGPFGIPGAIIGASLISGFMGGNAANKQAKVGKSQVAESRRQFDITRADTAPYREAGQAGVNKLQQLLMGGGEVTPEMMGPGYDWRLKQGQNALQSYLSGAGMKRSGRAMKEATRFGQGEASQGYQNYLANLFQLSGFGPQGVATSAGAGARVAGSPGYATQAAAAGGGPAAWNNAIQGGMSNYFAYKQNQNMMNMLGSGGQVPGDAYMPAARYG
jgi:hypothetical protein